MGRCAACCVPLTWHNNVQKYSTFACTFVELCSGENKASFCSEFHNIIIFSLLLVSFFCVFLNDRGITQLNSSSVSVYHRPPNTGSHRGLIRSYSFPSYGAPRMVLNYT